MAKLLTVKSNTAPNLVLTLERSGAAIDLTGCTVDLYINLSGTIVNTGHTTCSINSPATAGIVTYDLVAADTATPGLCSCEVKITYADTSVEILYQKFQLLVRDNLE